MRMRQGQRPSEVIRVADHHNPKFRKTIYARSAMFRHLRRTSFGPQAWCSYRTREIYWFGIHHLATLLISSTRPAPRGKRYPSETFFFHSMGGKRSLRVGRMHPVSRCTGLPLLFLYYPLQASKRTRKMGRSFGSTRAAARRLHHYPGSLLWAIRLVGSPAWCARRERDICSDARTSQGDRCVVISLYHIIHYLETSLLRCTGWNPLARICALPPWRRDLAGVPRLLRNGTRRQSTPHRSGAEEEGCREDEHERALPPDTKIDVLTQGHVEDIDESEHGLNETTSHVVQKASKFLFF
jgi:hypothetical protein